MSELRHQFGQRLRVLRRMRGLTQDQLAEATGVSSDLLSNIERGVNAPSFETLTRLAAALTVNVKDLFDFEDADSP